MIKQCKPEMGEHYWFLDSKFEPAMAVYDDRTVDCYRYYIGNRFNTEGEARLASKKVKELLLNLKNNNKKEKTYEDSY